MYFLSTHKTLAKFNTMLDHKADFNKFQIIETIQRRSLMEIELS